ncbi:amidohydrolase [Compostibacter hankyongensis]|uniref:Amidohydrolase n=1 Tax=Compostibacter hankyongensis TaxID=1007089 RepID=A0ABP8G9P8_9BACT
MSKQNFSRRKFIAGSGLLLIEASLRLKGATLPKMADEPIIDAHQHVHYLSRTNEQLLAHQRAMGVTTTILQPAGSPANRASTLFGFGNGLQAEAWGNKECYAFAKQYPKEFLFGSNEVPDLPGAVGEIEKYLKMGAVVIGESKFGIECDAPEMQRLYRLAQEYNVPIMMHWQYKKYNYGFKKFHKMLEKYPRVNFIGHSMTWWANIDKNNNDPTIMYPKGPVTPGGYTDRLLSDYPNVFGDLSAGSGLNAFTRDEAHGKEFMKKHQDKLIFGSDCTDTSGHSPTCIGANMIAEIRKLCTDKKVERKLLYENAKKLFRI